ncbi:MAG: substrate-binding domain-containing protein, partial [Betaproteobacteria bacterium]|nr:substrate-binding domain-containing protein [Betaproteobacteria bacterium]
GHPRRLAEAGRGEAVRLFARNRLCALAAPGFRLESATLLERMLEPGVKLGISTPKADPSGDYAWALFARAERVQAGAQAVLENKALKLTGGADSPPPPKDRSQYGQLVAEGKADLFLTYCTKCAAGEAGECGPADRPGTGAAGGGRRLWSDRAQGRASGGGEAGRLRALAGRTGYPREARLRAGRVQTLIRRWRAPVPRHSRIRRTAPVGASHPAVDCACRLGAAPVSVRRPRRPAGARRVRAGPAQFHRRRRSQRRAAGEDRARMRAGLPASILLFALAPE